MSLASLFYVLGHYFLFVVRIYTLLIYCIFMNINGFIVVAEHLRQQKSSFIVLSLQKSYLQKSYLSYLKSKWFYVLKNNDENDYDEDKKDKKSCLHFYASMNH